MGVQAMMCGLTLRTCTSPHLFATLARGGGFIDINIDEDLTPLIESEQASLFLVVVNDEPVGTIAIDGRGTDNDEVEILLLSILPPFRSRYYGRNAVYVALSVIEERWPERPVLATYPLHTAAKYIFDRTGFTRDDELGSYSRPYYGLFGVGERVIVIDTIRRGDA